MHSRTLESPFGPVSFTVDGGHLTRVWFGPAKDADMTPEPVADAVAAQLMRYFDGTQHTFDLPLAPPDNAFQAGIRACMIAIPYGEMRTYGDLARDLESAPQAVGQGCGNNPIPIIVPCHRVVASGGKLGGFSGGDGAPTKRKLLNHEAVHAP